MNPVKFEKHAFISYAHIDNKPISDEDEGWISDFHASLESLVSMKLGENVHIWRDNKLRGADIFDDEIVQQFPKTALLISVITPRYINSEWCTKEIEEFYKAASQNLGIRVENKSRILKVIKTPVNREKLPIEIADSLGYEFFKLDENGRPKEFNKAFGGEAEQAYLNRVDDLAYDIQEIIQLLNEGQFRQINSLEDAKLEISPANKKVQGVFVAQTSYDLAEARDQLVRELKDHGYSVYPDTNLSIYANSFREEVNNYLDKCQLSIHLVGQSYGAIPDGPELKSTLVHQNEVAAEKSKENGLPRIIWLPPQARVKDERQRQFVQQLNEDEAAQYGADLIEGSLEELKTALFERIRKLEKPSLAKVATSQHENDRKKVFLICDARDRSATVPLRKHLLSQQFEVNIPLFDGDPEEIRQDMRDNLQHCDALILFYGQGDEAWKRSMLSEIRKVGKERSQPLIANFTFLSGPESIDKEEMIEFEIPNLINGMDGFKPESLDEFVSLLQETAQK
ncbi:MAG: DUF4062 domain-containing protein [Cyclobacteriaceae bacterium]